MLCTHLVVPVLSLFTAAPEVVQSTGRAPEWLASVQAGAGQIGEDPAALILPRLAYTGARGDVSLAAPLWARLSDRAPRASEGGASWLMRWDDPALYLGFIERLSFETPGRAFTLFAGTLAQETLGHGVLVDHFQATLDPLWPRTGARVDLALGSVSGAALIDSFLQPHLVAASLSLAPLAWAGLDASNRFRVTLEGAADPAAPSAEPAAGGADLDVSLVVWRGATLELETYVAGALLSLPAAGAHGGLSLGWASRAEPRAYAVRFRLEGLAGGAGYTPGYFDAAYSMERQAIPARQWQPKAARHPPAAEGVRGALDVAAGPARFGLSTVVQTDDIPATAAVYVRITRPQWSLAAAVSQRALARFNDLWSVGPAASAVLEASCRLYDGLFAFGQVRRGLRQRAAAPPRPEADWLLGVGYGVQDG